MAVFDPNDNTLPQKLRIRFQRWATVTPKLQYSQYGPMDKYLNMKFPTGMVKPQGLLRKSSEQDEHTEFQDDLELPDKKHRFVKPEPDAETEGDEGLDDVGNVSIDSTGAFLKMCLCPLPLIPPCRAIFHKTGPKTLS